MKAENQDELVSSQDSGLWDKNTDSVTGRGGWQYTKKFTVAGQFELIGALKYVIL